MNESKQTDLHLLMGPPSPNLDAARQSCAIDAADDKNWFTANPDKQVRERPASERERAAAGLQLGAMAIIFRGPDGSQIRFLVQPDAERN